MSVDRVPGRQSQGRMSGAIVLDGEVTADVVAAHEAGHAVMAHLLGLTIRDIQLVPDDRTKARVGLVTPEVVALHPVDQKRLAFSGAGGETMNSGSFNGNHVLADLHVVQDWDAAPDFPGISGSYDLLEEHRPAWEAVRTLIALALESSHETIPGEGVHAAISQQGSEHGSARTTE